MFATGFNAVMAGTGSPSTVVSIEMHWRRLRKNMREPSVGNNLSSRSEDFSFFFFRQYSWMHSSETLSVMWILYVSRATCKPRQADTFGRLNRKTNVLCLHRSVGHYKNVSVSRLFMTDHINRASGVPRHLVGTSNPIIVRCCHKDPCFGHLVPWTCVRSCGSRGRHHF